MSFLKTIRVKLLIASLKSKNEKVREDACRKLGDLKDSHALEALIACLDDKESNVRSSAARALGFIGDVRALESLERTVLNDEDIVPRVAAAHALAHLGNYKYVRPVAHKRQLK
jgi:HEAT repeat protein